MSNRVSMPSIDKTEKKINIRNKGGASAFNADMLRDYFEKENLHYSEFLRMRRERRREERANSRRRIEAEFGFK